MFLGTSALAGCARLEKEPALYNCQFACNRQDYLAWKGKGAGKGKPPQGSGDVISTILKKSASGGDQFFVRKAQVIGLGELLFFFGKKVHSRRTVCLFCQRPQVDLQEAPCLDKCRKASSGH